MKFLIAILVMSVSSCFAHGQSTSLTNTAQVRSDKPKSSAAKTTAPASNHPTVADQNTLSSDFKKKAWRASDALGRVDSMVTKASASANRDLLVEAKKAVDDAKYDASTQLDDVVLHALQMAVTTLDFQMNFSSVLDPYWKRSYDRVSQCKTEVIYYVSPDQLSEIGRQKAQLGTCNKKTSEWDTGITR